MDEPFSALDAQTRTLMMEELLGIWERTRQDHPLRDAQHPGGGVHGRPGDRAVAAARARCWTWCRSGSPRPRVEAPAGRSRLRPGRVDRIWGLIKSQAQAALLEGDAVTERG